MSLLQKIALFLWLGSFAIATLAAHLDPQPFENHPKELVIRSLEMLDVGDLSHMANVAKKFRILVNESPVIWDGLLERKCGQYAKKLKPPSQTSREFYINFYPLHRSVSDILDIEHWPDEKIVGQFSEEKYAAQGIDLIKYQELYLTAKPRALSIKSAEQFISFYIAYQCYVSAAHAAAQKVGEPKIDRYWNEALLYMEDASESIRNEIEHQFFHKMGWCCDSDEDTEQKESPDEAMKTEYEKWGNAFEDWPDMWSIVQVVGPIAAQAIRTPRITTPMKHHDCLWQYVLGIHYVVAYMGQNPKVDEEFDQAYDAILDFLTSIRNLTGTPALSKKEVLQIIADHTWLRSEELAQNPCIISLKKVMEEAAEKVD